MHSCSNPSYQNPRIQPQWIFAPQWNPSLAMARCFHSSSFSAPCFKQEARFLRRNSTGWSFQMKSSNGYPPNAVPVQDGLSGSSPSKENVKYQYEETSNNLSGPAQLETTVSITVVGASGDLARKKIFPALFSLYYADCLPKHFTVFGYARSKLTDEELRNMISETLTCRVGERENCTEKMEQFLQKCFYHSGQYGSEESFLELDKKLKEKEVVSLHIIRQLNILEPSPLLYSMPQTKSIT